MNIIKTIRLAKYVAVYGTAMGILIAGLTLPAALINKTYRLKIGNSEVQYCEKPLLNILILKNGKTKIKMIDKEDRIDIKSSKYGQAKIEKLVITTGNEKDKYLSEKNNESPFRIAIIEEGNRIYREYRKQIRDNMKIGEEHNLEKLTEVGKEAQENENKILRGN
jgi:hypothetical protein